MLGKKKFELFYISFFSEQSIIFEKWINENNLLSKMNVFSLYSILYKNHLSEIQLYKGGL